MLKLLTSRQVAEMLSLNYKTVYDLARDGVLPSYKIRGAVRFCEQDVLAYVESVKRPPLRGYNRTSRLEARKGGQRS